MRNFIDVSLLIAETEETNKLPTCSSRPEDKNGDFAAVNQANASSSVDSTKVLMFLFFPLIVVLVSKLADLVMKIVIAIVYLINLMAGST